MALVAFGLAACGDDDSKSTVTDEETTTETVTTPAQAEPGAPTTTPAPQKTPGSGSDQKDGPGTGGTQAKCPPGQIPVIATGGCAKE